MENNSTSRFPLFSRQAWEYFARYYRGLYTRLGFSSLISASQVVLILPVILLVKYAFDIVIPEGKINMLVAIGIAIFLLRLINSGVSLWVRQMNITLINTAVFRLRSGLLHRLYSLPRSFYTREDHRILHARIVQDSERLTHLSNALISRIFPAVIISLALCVLLLFLNWYILLIILSVSPLLLLANRIMSRRIKDKVIVFQRVFENFSKGILFVLRYMDLTKIQSAQEEEIERQEKVLAELKEKTGSMTMVYALNSQLQEVLTGISGVLIIILGGAAVANGGMSLGDFLSFYIAAVYLNKNINTITSAFPDVLAGNESMVTLFKLANSPEVQPYQGSRKISFKGNIALNRLTFGYGDEPVLRGIDLDIEAGSQIAIIGANGAGKTTLIQLMMGFYRPWSGDILVDGMAYDELDMADLRRQLGVVMQNPLLFSGSIRDNMVYGSPDITDTEMQHALGLAMATQFIEKLPDGIDTQIGEEGVRLSGGERQRLAIARALVRKPRLLILDEPTNHIEYDDVGKIIQGIAQLPYKPTILLISHDLQVIQFAPKVYRLEKGMLQSETKQSLDNTLL